MSLREVFDGLTRHPFFPSDLKHFLTGAFFARLGNSLLMIAGPVYLYTIAEHIPALQQLPLGNMERGLLFVVLFLLGERLLNLLLTPFLTQVISRIGLMNSLVLGLFFTIIRFASYSFFVQAPWLILVAIICTALSVVLYWIPYHTFFTTEVKTHAVGHEVGSMEFLMKLAAVIAPLLGALLSARVGFTATVLGGITAYVIASLFYLTLPNWHLKTQWSWTDFRLWVQYPTTRALPLGLSGFMWHEIGMEMFWPLFLFFTFEHIETVGYIISSATLLSLMFVYLSGLVFDHHKNNRWQTMSGLFVGVLWLVRMGLSHSPLALVFTDALDRLSFSVYGTLFNASMLLHAKGERVYLFYINRNIAITLFLLVACSLCVVLILIGWSWNVLFLTFMAGTLISLVVRDPHWKRLRQRTT